MEPFVMTQSSKLPYYPTYRKGFYWSPIMERYFRIVDIEENKYIIEVYEGIKVQRDGNWLKQRQPVYKAPLS